MKRSKMVGLAFVGSIGLTTMAYAAGMFPDYPIVGGASYCAGTSSTTIGSIIGSVTGCPNTVPAGPTVVTGSEVVPADTRLSGGAAPQTVLLSMASLNALPITVSAGNLTAANPFSASNTVGGIILTAPGNMSLLNVSLPPAPIDGQQFVVASNRTINVLSVAATSPSTQSITNAPTVLTLSTTAPFNYRFMWNAAVSTWYRLQ